MWCKCLGESSSGFHLRVSFRFFRISFIHHWRRFNVEKLFRVLNKLQQTAWHIIRSSDSIVQFTILAKTQEDCVDCHLVDGEEALTDETWQKGAANDWEKWILQAGFVLKCSIDLLVVLKLCTVKSSITPISSMPMKTLSKTMKTLARMRTKSPIDLIAITPRKFLAIKLNARFPATQNEHPSNEMIM